MKELLTCGYSKGINNGKFLVEKEIIALCTNYYFNILPRFNAYNDGPCKQITETLPIY